MSEPSMQKTGSRKEFMRLFGSAPWLKEIESKDYRVKVFKSGNSVALRLPAELGLKPGSELNMRVENGEITALEPVDLPKRKFNAAKIAGSASDLRPVKDEDRAFDARPIAWNGPDETNQ